MTRAEIDLIFPSRAIEVLRLQRGEAWEKLVEKIIKLPADDPEHIAFVLMMVRMSGCATCQSDSFRAMKGCSQCAVATVKRYKGLDQNLMELFSDAKKDIAKYLDEE